MKNALTKAMKTNEGILFVIFVLTFILMSVLSPGKFLTFGNLQSMAYQLPEFGILALAMMLVIVSGGINLSLTYTATLSMIVGGGAMSALFAATKDPFSAIVVGIIVMVAVSLLCGAFNGAVVAYIGVTPMLATLGAMTLFEGISLNITKGGAISGFPLQFLSIGSGTVLGIPIPLIIFLAVIFGTYFFLERSRIGAAIYMIGCNPKVSRYSGIKVAKVLFVVYMVSSAMAAVAGVLMASRYNSAKESYGSSYLLQAVAAAVLGGTSIVGGEGRTAGTIIAVLIIQTISSGLNIFGINRYLTNIVMGGILVVVLGINFFANRKPA